MALHPMFTPVNGRKPKVLLEITYAYDDLFMLDEMYEHSPQQRHPVSEGPDPAKVYQDALQRVALLRRAGYDVALDAKHRIFT